jgi:hypothetical protein
MKNAQTTRGIQPAIKHAQSSSLDRSKTLGFILHLIDGVSLGMVTCQEITLALIEYLKLIW